jgi:hypothetical protein
MLLESRNIHAQMPAEERQACLLLQYASLPPRGGQASVDLLHLPFL